MSDETKMRLLVVDDEQSIRRLCMTIGNTLGYACSEAETAEVAVARLEQAGRHHGQVEAGMEADQAPRV